MITQRELMLNTPYVLLFFDLKVIIPAIIAVGLTLKNPIITKIIETIGVTGYKLIVIGFVAFAAIKFGENIGNYRNALIMGDLEGFDISSMKVGTF
jgi:hypothetical protein